MKEFLIDLFEEWCKVNKQSGDTLTKVAVIDFFDSIKLIQIPKQCGICGNILKNQISKYCKGECRKEGIKKTLLLRNEQYLREFGIKYTTLKAQEWHKKNPDKLAKRYKREYVARTKKCSVCKKKITDVERRHKYCRSCRSLGYKQGRVKQLAAIIS